MKNIKKKWYFWLITLIFVICIVISINYIMEQKELKQTAKNIGRGASDYINGIENANSHLNEFSYNYETGKVEYKPSEINLEMYNRIKKEMTQEDVVSILGNYDNKLDGENTYMLEWGNSYAPINNGYWIQIVFDMNKKVLSMYQMGLK